MKKKVERLLYSYDVAANNLAKEFVEQIEFCWDDCYWIGGDYGGMLSMGDYFINMQDIIDGLRYNASCDDFIKWYDYTLDAYGTDTPVPNFKNWLKGCPRASDEELRILKEKAENAKKILLDSIRTICDDYEDSK